MAAWQAAGGRTLLGNDRRTERQSLRAEAASPLARGAGRRVHGSHCELTGRILAEPANSCCTAKTLPASAFGRTLARLRRLPSPRLLNPRTPALYSQCRHEVPARMRTTSHPMAVSSECLAVRHRYLRNARQRLLSPTVRVVRMGGRDIGGTIRKRTCTVACGDAASVDPDCPARPQPARQDIGGLFICAGVGATRRARRPDHTREAAPHAGRSAPRGGSARQVAPGTQLHGRNRTWPGAGETLPAK